MDGPSTALEQYFNRLINMRLLTQVVVSDKQGNTILACFGATAPVGNDVPDEELPMESNVAVSGARYFQNLEQLRLGTPTYITAQYHDAAVVQLMESCGAMLTLIGSRAKGHFTGGLLSLVSQIRSTSVYVALLRGVVECTQ